ncbi:hypothetical protein DFH07DRAFT_966490 [Mycena maculata]|uniref:DUF6532 domain-containing protein n=1 Tax=Mycena maculata TaxID=230809 RepID=A0AAD7MXZ4_9AGAR|nr:hypothetical protein DFH07DRAFT_966490 [Mycena maculata]
MSAQSTVKLTPAEKRKITLAAKVERERQEQAQFVAKSKGGRKAKADANANAIWKSDQTGSRKRTSSTTQVPESGAKKARGSENTSDPKSEEEQGPEIPAAVKVKASGKKYAAPSIDVDSDGSEAETTKHPRIDLTNLPVYKAKPTASTKVKVAVSKGLQVFTHVKSAVKTGPGAKKTAPARIVAESASEAEAISSEEHSDEGNSGQSDNENFEDVSPNEAEFRTEVPHLVSKKSTVDPTDSVDESDKDIKMKDKHRVHNSDSDYESDMESIEIDKPRPKKAAKERQIQYDHESDDSISDAPKRVPSGNSDIDMPQANNKGHAVARSFHSRRSSVASWSSGQDLMVPDSEAETPADEDKELPVKKSRKAVAHDNDMALHEAIAKGLTAVPRHGHSRHSSTASMPALAPVSDSDSDDGKPAPKLNPVPKKSRKATRDEGDNDMALHEAIAKGLTTIPRRSHSRHSSTTSARDHRVPDSDAEDDAKPAPKPGPKKSRMVSAARQQKADLEKPEVRVPLPDPRTLSKGLKAQLERIAGASADADKRPESEWHISARILFPAPGKDIGLTDQSEELKAVLRGCIEFIKLSLLFEDSYPSIISRAGFARAYLIAAANRSASAHIKERLETDMNFAALLADIPLDRINILRGDMKRIATQETPGLYRIALLPAPAVKTLVNDLIQDHRYIFPVDPTTGRLKTELPFHHEAIISLLKKGVFTGQFKTKNLHLFASTSKKHPEDLELPDAMICLAATAVYGSLMEYRATGTQQKIPFTEGAYEDTYRNHMKTLGDTRAAAPVSLHKVLHSLFNLVTETTASTSNAAGSSAILINLVEVPESD